MDLGLQGKQAIVTGGSRGIGKAIARELARGHRRHHFAKRVVLRDFDVDDLGIARAEAAQLIAYHSGSVFVVEEFLPLATLARYRAVLLIWRLHSGSGQYG